MLKMSVLSYINYTSKWLFFKKENALFHHVIENTYILKDISAFNNRLFVFLCLFFYFERERAQAEERQRERGRERIPSRLCTVSTESDVGLELTNCEIMTLAETKSLMLNEVSHHGAPRLFF